ncbi:MAG: hypothetical protein KJ050_06660 [Candidatus Omnitrophica bacterium]|nr:hypothetical protein [bacterium]MCE7908063.1 hypothetical protein [Candidatus Omnitrophica bacterium COP1]MCL4734602.1 hypothetical protein [Candidatus Omnitrophota bacterium]MBV6482634.1 Adaptive-response sensory-kinase SasA [bacterium]MCK6497641.1 HAMP domain-containing histidine kinase [bacterium]
MSHWNLSQISGHLSAEIAGYQRETESFSLEELQVLAVLGAGVERTLDPLKLNLLFERIFSDLGYRLEIQILSSDESPPSPEQQDSGHQFRFHLTPPHEMEAEDFQGWIELIPIDPYKKLTQKEETFLQFLCRQVSAVLAHQWLYQNLERTREKLQAALSTVQEISAFIGHEIRSPISSLLSLGFMMEEDIRELSRKPSPSMEEWKSFLDQMAQAVALMQKITRSTYLLGTLEIDPTHSMRDLEWVEVGKSLIGTASTAYSFDIRRRGLKVVVRKESSFAHEHVLVQRAWFEAIFDNLLGNAIKYSSEGGRIDFSILRREGFYIIHVSNPVDNPTSPDRLNRLFEKGYRGADAAFNIQTIGANQGLGLYFVNRIVTLGYGGRIFVWLDSQRNSDGVREGESVETQVFGDPDSTTPEGKQFFHIEIRIPEKTLLSPLDFEDQPV